MAAGDMAAKDKAAEDMNYVFIVCHVILTGVIGQIVTDYATVLVLLCGP